MLLLLLLLLDSEAEKETLIISSDASSIYIIVYSPLLKIFATFAVNPSKVFISEGDLLYEK